MQSGETENSEIEESLISTSSQDETNNIQIFKTRFGEIKINSEKKINFKNGILGIGDNINFCLADFPNQNVEQFKLLQCLEDDTLCFLTMPAYYDNNIIKNEDIKDACSNLEISSNNIIILFITTIHKDSKISINAQAPIIVNTQNKTATQYVFQNSEYKIQHFIS